MLALAPRRGHARFGCRLVNRWSGVLRAACCAWWRRLILGCALRLHLFGDKAALGHQPAFDERLRTVLESIGKGIAANVADRQVFTLLLKDKIDAVANMRNRPGADIAGNCMR